VLESEGVPEEQTDEGAGLYPEELPECDPSTQDMTAFVRELDDVEIRDKDLYRRPSIATFLEQHLEFIDFRVLEVENLQHCAIQYLVFYDALEAGGARSTSNNGALVGSRQDSGPATPVGTSSPPTDTSNGRASTFNSQWHRQAVREVKLVACNTSSPLCVDYGALYDEEVQELLD